MQEEEDQAQHRPKDVVDSSLAAWKDGKETNLCALFLISETVSGPRSSKRMGWDKLE